MVRVPKGKRAGIIRVGRLGVSIGCDIGWSGD
jgi:hypothetical protein